MTAPTFDDLDQLFRELMNSTQSQAANHLNNYAHNWEYQGFDPVAVIDSLNKKCGTANVPITTVAGFGVALAVDRGTNLQKIMLRVNDKTKVAIELLLKVVTTKKGASLSKSDITLPRLCACYPGMTAEYITQRGAKFRCPLPIYAKLPNIVRSTYLASIMPSGMGWATVARANFAFLLDYEELTRGKSKISVQQQMAFWTASHGSIVMTNEERIRLCHKIGLTVDSANEFFAENPTKNGETPAVIMAPPVTQVAQLGNLGFKAEEDSQPRTATPPHPDLSAQGRASQGAAPAGQVAGPSTSRPQNQGKTAKAQTRPSEEDTNE